VVQLKLKVHKSVRAWLHHVRALNLVANHLGITVHVVRDVLAEACSKAVTHEPQQV